MLGLWKTAGQKHSIDTMPKVSEKNERAGRALQKG